MTAKFGDPCSKRPINRPFLGLKILIKNEIHWSFPVKLPLASTQHMVDIQQSTKAGIVQKVVILTENI